MNERTVYAGMAVAIGRFNPNGVDGYRAATAPNAPLRATRQEAIEDERAWLDDPHCAECANPATHKSGGVDLPRLMLCVYHTNERTAKEPALWFKSI